jgi:hypothetical protein
LLFKFHAGNVISSRFCRFILKLNHVPLPSAASAAATAADDDEDVDDVRYATIQINRLQYL